MLAYPAYGVLGRVFSPLGATKPSPGVLRAPIARFLLKGKFRVMGSQCREISAIGSQNFQREGDKALLTA